jgi:hypothetical protein
MLFMNDEPDKEGATQRQLRPHRIVRSQYRKQTLLLITIMLALLLGTVKATLPISHEGFLDKAHVPSNLTSLRLRRNGMESIEKSRKEFERQDLLQMKIRRRDQNQQSQNDKIPSNNPPPQIQEEQKNILKETSIPPNIKHKDGEEKVNQQRTPAPLLTLCLLFCFGLWLWTINLHVLSFYFNVSSLLLLAPSPSSGALSSSSSILPTATTSSLSSLKADTIPATQSSSSQSSSKPSSSEDFYSSDSKRLLSSVSPTHHLSSTRLASIAFLITILFYIPTILYIIQGWTFLTHAMTLLSLVILAIAVISRFNSKKPRMFQREIGYFFR